MRLIVLDFDHGWTSYHYGDEVELTTYLRVHYPEVWDCYDLEQCINRLNKSGEVEVRVETMPEEDSNLLPDGYLTSTQGDFEDPWPRAADTDPNG